ncbi:hypothetical protein Tco_1447279 [Tanacetum coccineum]
MLAFKGKTRIRSNPKGFRRLRKEKKNWFLSEASAPGGREVIEMLLPRQQGLASWWLQEETNKKELFNHKEEMDQETAQTTTTAKLPILKQGPVTTEENAQKKNDLKARSMLLMALPNEHLMTFNQYNDAKTLFAAIQTRFGGNEATKKTLKTLLKQITASTQVSTTNLSDDTVYAFLANQQNGSQLVYKDLEQVHENDIEEIDLKWQLALLSMRTRRWDTLQGNAEDLGTKIAETGIKTALEGLVIFTLKFDLSNSGLEEFQQPDFEGYGPKTSKSVSEDISNEANCNYHQRERVVSRSNYTRVNYNYFVEKAHLVALKGHPQIEDQGYVDSGCSRHMTENMSYLSDFKEFDGGYVTFGGGAKEGKITSKGTLKTIVAGTNSNDLVGTKERMLVMMNHNLLVIAGKKDDNGVCKESGIADHLRI